MHGPPRSNKGRFPYEYVMPQCQSCIYIRRNRFRLHVTVPADWPASTEEPTLLVWDSGSEAMVWTEDGEPQQVDEGPPAPCLGQNG